MTQTEHRDAATGCPWAEWLAGNCGTHRYALHPAGFRVYIRPDRLDAANEYSEGDPYRVSENMESAFHRRRFTETAALIDKAVLEKEIDGAGTGLSVVDIGCGEGHITADIHRKLPSSHVTGFDYSLDAVRTATTTYQGVEFAVVDAYDLPCDANSVDLVVINNLWEHVPDPLRLLAEVGRVLKSGGYVIMSTPSRYRIHNLIRVLMGKRVVMMSKHHVTEYTVGQIKEQFAFCGFEIKIVQSGEIGIGGRGLRFAILGGFKRIVKLILFITKSHHNLEATVFYLAQKT